MRTLSSLSSLSSLPTLLVALSLVACGDKDQDTARYGGGGGPEDADGDGFSIEEDCDDADASVYPGADELCDGVDNDCDDEVDEAAVDASLWYADADGDGHGDASGVASACVAPSGYVAEPDDCDDADAAVSPDADELCDGVDNDCDGDVDEPDAADAATWYGDGDADGYGDADRTQTACSQPVGFVDDDTDCNDQSDAAYPGAEEICDGLDNDCNGETDEDASADAVTWYADLDGDGFGDPGVAVTQCAQPTDHVLDGTDCDDAQSTTNPGASEYCDGVDNDCDGTTDEDDAADATTWYGDADGDGFGGTTFQTTACSQPASYVTDNTDCDDLSADSYPGASEVCDDADNDCDGSTDEGIGSTWYADADGDGYGDAGSTTTDCEQPSGYVSDDTDCDDSDGDSNPGGVEVCDGADNDCDGTVDDEAEVIGTAAACAADSCMDVLTADPGATDGPYYLDLDGAGDVREAWCEMDLEGGGWLAVFNWMDPGTSTTSDAATLHAALIVNDDMLDAVEPDETSTAIETANVDLSAYNEVLYGWAASENDDVTRYASYTDSGGLTGECYVDGYCGAGVTVATMTVVPTGSVRQFQTGNSPTYPHVGLGWNGQIITWGYDLNTSSYGNWANWYDTKSCCTAGATSEMLTRGWRYTIYIR
jgi:hypothetical protein